MNLKLHALALALCAGSAASAQQSIGIQAGAGIGRVSSDFFENKGAPHLRLNAGVTYQRFISKHLTLGADLLYQQRGWRDQLVMFYVGVAPAGTVLIPFRFNYAALPLKIGYRSSNAKPVFGFGRLGVVPGVLLKASYDRYLTTRDETVKEDITNDYKRFDIAGIVEAGGGWALNEKLRLELGAAFQYSFISFARPWLRAQHLGLSGNLGLRYELGVKKGGAAAPLAD